MDTIKEQTTATLEFAFYDENAAAVIPDNGSFQLYDKFSGTAIRNGSISGLAATMDFDLTTTDNTLLDQTARYEIRVLEVEYTYTTKTGRGLYEYKVENLSYLT
jgi:hypothetical protein